MKNNMSIKCSAISEMFNKKHMTVWQKLYVICILLMSSLIVLMFSGQDLHVTVAHSVYTIDALVHGEILDIYTIFYENPMTEIAYYDIPIYLVFGMWNIPVYIMFKLGIPFQVDQVSLTPGVLLWNKIFLLLLSFMMVRYIVKIIKKVYGGEQNTHQIVLFVVSSFFFTYPVLLVCQYDIIGVVFTLMGVLGFLENDNKKFMLGFILAIGIKNLPFIIFFPLLLLKEKNLLKIIIQSAMSLFLPLLCRLIYGNDSAYAYSNSFPEQKIGMLLKQTMSGNFGQIPVVVVLFAVIFICAYYINVDIDKRNKCAMMFSFASCAVLFMFSEAATYWIIMIVPYYTAVVFSAAEDKWKFKVNLILTSFMEIIASILWLYYHSDNIDYHLAQKPVIGILQQGAPTMSAYSIVNNMGFGQYITALCAVFISLMAAVLFLNCGKFNIKSQYNKKRNVEGYICIRYLATVWFFVFCVACFCYKPSFEFRYYDMKTTRYQKFNVGEYKLDKGDIVFGPYCVLYPGWYEIRVRGTNLNEDNTSIEVASDQGNMDIFDVMHSGQEVSYKIFVETKSEGVEFKLFNNKDDEISFENLVVTYLHY